CPSVTFSRRASSETPSDRGIVACLNFIIFSDDGLVIPRNVVSYSAVVRCCFLLLSFLVIIVVLLFYRSRKSPIVHRVIIGIDSGTFFSVFIPCSDIRCNAKRSSSQSTSNKNRIRYTSWTYAARVSVRPGRSLAGIYCTYPR